MPAAKTRLKAYESAAIIKVSSLHQWAEGADCPVRFLDRGQATTVECGHSRI